MSDRTLNVSPGSASGAGALAVWWSLAAYLIRLGLAGVFLLAAWNKIAYMGVSGSIADIGVAGPVNFAEAIRAYRIPLPDPLVSFATYAIPFTELLVAAALILGLWARAASLLYVLLMGVFLVGIVNAIMNNYDIKCGCFGDLKFFCDGAVNMCKVRENVGFALAASTILVFGPGRLSLDWVVRRG